MQQILQMFMKCIVSDPLSETTVSFQSDLFNDAVSRNQRSIYVKSEQVKVGSWWRRREREREQQQINRVKDRALDRNGSGVDQKWLLEKLNT